MRGGPALPVATDDSQGYQRLPDGARYRTTLEITPTHAEAAATGESSASESVDSEFRTGRPRRQALFIYALF